MIMAGVLGACGFDEPDNPEPVPEPPTEVTRAVLVYMVANNSLGSSTVPGEEEYGRGFDKSDLREMAKAAREGSLGANRLLVYHHAYLSEPRIIEITPDGERELKEYDTSELSVSTSRMTRVIDDFMELAPARNYGIVLWSHADGWLDNGIEEEAQTIMCIPTAATWRESRWPTSSEIPRHISSAQYRNCRRRVCPTTAHCLT